MRGNLTLFWLMGFLALGSLSALGAASLFPLPLAIVVAITVAGLGSALAFQFRATGNLIFLLVAGSMILIASFLDGVSVWEVLNKRQNTGVAEVRAGEAAAVRVKEEAEARVAGLREEIARLVREATDMDNDGRKENDHLVAGQLALVESRKADLANLEAQAGVARKDVATMAATAAGRESATHYFLQMANAAPEPARWLIQRATIIFLPLEFALAVLAWSLQGQMAEIGAPTSPPTGAPTPPRPRSGTPRPAIGAPTGVFPRANGTSSERARFRPFNLNRLRQHLRLLRREGIIPAHRITSGEISNLSRAEAIALCEEFKTVPSDPILLARPEPSPTGAVAMAG